MKGQPYTGVRKQANVNEWSVQYTRLEDRQRSTTEALDKAFPNSNNALIVWL